MIKDVLQPIAITQPSWRTYIEVCQDVLGYSPTRGLDKSGVNVKDIEAFLITLDLENGGVESIREPNRALNHISLSYMGLLSKQILIDLQSNTTLYVISKRIEDEYLCVVSGTMMQFYFAILICCSEKVTLKLRQLFNGLLSHIESTGLREVFSTKRKRYLADSTFILV